MSSIKRAGGSVHRAGAAPVLAVSIAALLAACAQDGTTALPTLGAVPQVTETTERSPAAPATAAAPAPSTAILSPAIAEARDKRRAGDKAAALTVLERAARQDPKDTLVQKERGLLLLELGQVKKAESALRIALDAKQPDWRTHSGLGAALAAQGRQPDAQMQFAKALELAPDHPSVLNNLALSYALDGKPAEAERMLKRIPASAQQAKRASQNLALLAGLGGRTQEAEKLAAAALPVEQAKANVALLEQSGASPSQSSNEQRPQRAATAAATAPQTSFRLGGPRD